MHTSQYTQLNDLGHGARSRIVLIVDEKTGQKYALKRVPKRSSWDERFIEQTENEYEVSRSFQHPVLRKSFSLHRIRRWLRLVEVQLLMEYFPGRNLEEFKTTMPIPQLVSIFTKVVEGLQSLHQLGYVHGDIKPNNILVEPDTQEVRIIDFGQSCRIGAIKERVQGTPGYIAPEQVDCLPLDQRTDVFNLGATMYWMLTGKPWPTRLPGKQMRPGQRLKPDDWLTSSPTPGQSPSSGATNGTGLIAKTPEEVNPNVSKSLSLLVIECCQDQPKDRPADMREVLNRLALAPLQPRPQQLLL